MKRKEFLQRSVPAFLLLANGNILKAEEQMAPFLKKKKRIRFAIASDVHYGEPKTAYAAFLKTAVENLNQEHRKDPFQFCMFNGDIVHDDPKFYPEVKDALKQLQAPYHVTIGNHDRVTPAQWEQIWAEPVNYHFKIGNTVFLAAATSNEKGKYICPDLTWMEQQLKKHRKAKNIFIFIHINPAKQTTHAIDCPEFLSMLKKYKNVRAVFNGHDHDEDGIKTKEGIPFIFDAHVGGSWGTAYRGFRVVELLEDNSVLTYIMNPAEKINLGKL